jgi:preprotein translocase subunit SecF
MQFIKPGTTFDFVGKRRFAAIISGLLVVASLLLFFVKGPNWGIDFTGGTEIQVKFEQPTEIGDVRDVLTQLELSNDAVQQVGAETDYRYIIRIQDTTYGAEELRDNILGTLEDRFGADWIAETSFDAQIGARLLVRYTGDSVPIEQVEMALSGFEGAKVADSPDDNTVQVKLPGVSAKVQKAIEGAFDGRDMTVEKTDQVGPKVGGELRRKGFLAIAATLALILVYVAFRFDLAFAPGAVLALFHDVSIVVGIFVITRHEFNLPMIGALLTIIGYSLNDTIVIYDRIRENMRRYRRADTARLINDSINETMTRTLATSFTTGIAMLAFLFLGGPVIETFALAILLGVIFGTYSTIFVASPTILIMEDLRPHLSRMVAPLAGASDEDEEDDEGGELYPPVVDADGVETPAAAAPVGKKPMTRAEARRRRRKELRDAAAQGSETPG